jgi:hypothetical protein
MLARIKTGHRHRMKHNNYMNLVRYVRWLGDAGGKGIKRRGIFITICWLHRHAGNRVPTPPTIPIGSTKKTLKYK